MNFQQNFFAAIFSLAFQFYFLQSCTIFISHSGRFCSLSYELFSYDNCRHSTWAEERWETKNRLRRCSEFFFLKEFWKKKSNLRDANFNLLPFISSRERERWFRANWDCSLGGLDEHKTFLFVVFMLSSLMGKQRSQQQKKISWSKKQFQDFFQSLDLTSLRYRLIRAQQKMTSCCELAWEFSLRLLLEKKTSREWNTIFNERCQQRRLELNQQPKSR